MLPSLFHTFAATYKINPCYIQEHKVNPHAWGAGAARHTVPARWQPAQCPTQDYESEEIFR